MQYINVMSVIITQLDSLLVIVLIFDVLILTVNTPAPKTDILKEYSTDSALCSYKHCQTHDGQLQKEKNIRIVAAETKGQKIRVRVSYATSS